MLRLWCDEMVWRNDHDDDDDDDDDVFLMMTIVAIHAYIHTCNIIYYNII